MESEPLGLELVHVSRRYHGRGGLEDLSVTVAPGQVVPNDDHSNAPSEPDQDQSRHVLRLVAEKKNCQSEHEQRSDDPILN